MISEQIAIYIYIRVLRSFITEVYFGFTMARIQLILLALLATSISVRARSVGTNDVVDPFAGEIQIYCDICLQRFHLYLHYNSVY
jgi:hypothetical protein